MTNSKSTKRALLLSALSILMCVAMLVGTTFAWFTDTASTAVNKIQAGTLDVALEMLVNDEWVSAENKTLDFVKAADAPADEQILWEPGCTYELPALRLRNNGNLALKYKILVTGIDGDAKLLEAIDWTITYPLPAAATASLTENNSNEGYLLPNEVSATPITISGHMREDAGNEYQGKSIEGIGITVLATQFTYEYDSEDNTYDANAEYPIVWTGDVATDEELTEATDTTAKTLTINTPELLAAFAEEVNSGNKFSGYTVTLTTDVDLKGAKWTPIGTDTAPFEGKFDGQGHTVSNLNIDMASTNSVGFFGRTNIGSVKNLKFHNATVKGNLKVGVVAGTPYTTEYSDITITGTVKVDGYAYVGGAFGYSAYDDLTNITINVDNDSYVRADSHGFRTYVGGVVGFMGEGNHTVSNVTSNIDVYGSTCDVGGITGIAHYGNTFKNCSSSGNVTITTIPDDAGDELEIGGIAGVWHNDARGTVTFDGCSFTGTLTNQNGSDLSGNTITGPAYNRNGTCLDNLTIR